MKRDCVKGEFDSDLPEDVTMKTLGDDTVKKAFVTPELLITITLIALCVGVTLPIIGAIRAGTISAFLGSILMAILPMAWLVFRISSWLRRRRLAQR